MHTPGTIGKRATTMTLTPPTFNTGDIVDTNDGTLHRNVLLAGQGLAVHVPLWPNPAQQPGQFDLLDLEWAAGEAPGEDAYELVESHALEGPIDAGSFPMTLRVPADRLRLDGPYRLRYRVVTWDSALAACEPVPIRCDSVPPFPQAEPPAAGIPDEPITDAYLDAHPEGLAWTLPAYADYQPGDIVQFWYANPLPEDPGSLPFETVTATPPPMTLHVSRQAVEAAGDGGCYLAYRVLDKATNPSALSGWVRLAVALGPLPTNLPPPQVPLADDGLLHLQDALEGIDVVIPAFANGKASDRLVIVWGGIRLPESPLGETPDFPLTIRMPDQVLRDAYGAATGPVATDVGYEVLRGDVVFPAPTITVTVDLHVAGPELPEWPDLVNPQLSAPRVFGAESNELNTLTRDDEEQPAAFKLDLYTPLTVGEQIEFYWDGTLVTEATHTVGEGDQPGTELSVSIPWDYIADAGNKPALPVFYRIRNPGSPNAQQSPVTHVNADAYTLIPPAPSYAALTGPNDLLSCQHLDDDDAIEVEVPDLSRWLQDGAQVTVTWTPLVGPQDDIVLEAAVKEEVLTLGPDHPVSGFIWQVKPYDVHILPIYHYDDAGTPPKRWGAGVIRYAFMLDGEQINSAREQRVVAMFNGGQSCELKSSKDV
jgi:hypothetical protein